MSTSESPSFVDIHNHLVPGVDDGARDVAAVLDSVERMTRVGIHGIVTTPHIEGSLTHDHARLEDRLSEVSEAWERAAEAVGKAYPEVEYRRGHEVLLDVPDADLSDPRIRMAGTSFALIEWPGMQLPPATVRVLSEIVAQGYRPVVAHPERYGGLAEAIEIVAEWRDAGALLQVNLGSLVGRYGARAESTAYRLLRRGWVDYLGSDFHGHPKLKLYQKEASEALRDLGADEVLTRLYSTNPARLLDDEEPLPVAPLPPERGLWARIRGMLTPSTA